MYLVIIFPSLPSLVSLVSSFAHQLDIEMLIFVFVFLFFSSVSLPSSFLYFLFLSCLPSGLVVSSFRWYINWTYHTTDRTSKHQPCPLGTRPTPWAHVDYGSVFCFLSFFSVYFPFQFPPFFVPFLPFFLLLLFLCNTSMYVPRLRSWCCLVASDTGWYTTARCGSTVALGLLVLRCTYYFCLFSFHRTVACLVTTGREAYISGRWANARSSSSSLTADVWEGDTKLVKQLETVQMTAARKVLGCSSTTSNTVFRADMRMNPLKANRREKVEMAI